MGRKTYEFGYAHGLEPGANPYPNMDTLVVSPNLTVPNGSETQIVSDLSMDFVVSLKSMSRGPTYLCGGGELAGWLLKKELIDFLVLKRTPCIFGTGVRLFDGTTNSQKLERTDDQTYGNGYVLEKFKLV